MEQGRDGYNDMIDAGRGGYQDHCEAHEGLLAFLNGVSRKEETAKTAPMRRFLGEAGPWGPFQLRES